MATFHLLLFYLLLIVLSMKNKYTIPYHDHDCNACLSCGTVGCWRWQAVDDFVLSSWAPKPRCCMDSVSSGRSDHDIGRPDLSHGRG